MSACGYDRPVAVLERLAAVDNREDRIRLLAAACEDFPFSHTLVLNLAREYIDAGRQRCAADRFAPLLASGEPLSEAVFGLAVEARVLLEEFDGAAAFLDVWEQQHPGSWRAARARLALLRRTGDEKGRSALLAEYLKRWPGDLTFVRPFAADRLESRDPGEAVAAFDTAWAQGADHDPGDYLRLARGLLSQGEVAHLSRLVRAGLAQHPGNGVLALFALAADCLCGQVQDGATLEIELDGETGLQGRWIADQVMIHAGADTALRFCATVSGGEEVFAAFRARALSRLGDAPAALRAFAQACKVGSLTVSEAMTQANLLALTGELDGARQAFSMALSMAADPQARLRVRIYEAHFLVSIGARDEALAGLKEHDGQVGDLDMGLRRDWLVWSLSGRPVSHNGADSLVFHPDDVCRETGACHYRFGKEECLVAFSPIVLSNMAVYLDALLPVCRSLGVSVVAVFDPTALGSTTGFMGEQRNWTESGLALAELLGRLGYERAAAFGTSASGAAANAWACQNGADGSLSVSGFSYWPTAEQVTDPRFHPIRIRLEAYGGHEVFDLDAHLRAAPHVQIVHHYGARSAIDCEHAERLEGRANVTLVRHEEADHHPFMNIVQAGKLEAEIRFFLQRLGWR